MSDPTRVSSPQAPPISFRAPRLEPQLLERGDAAGQVARRDLERLYALMPLNLRALNLTVSEAQLLADASNGTLWEPSSIPLLWSEVEDAIRLDGLAEKWSVDAPSLLLRLTTLSPLESLAVVDALERAWRMPGGPTPANLRAVGLVRRPDPRRE